MIYFGLIICLVSLILILTDRISRFKQYDKDINELKVNVRGILKEIYYRDRLGNEISLQQLISDLIDYLDLEVRIDWKPHARIKKKADRHGISADD